MIKKHISNITIRRKKIYSKANLKEAPPHENNKRYQSHNISIHPHFYALTTTYIRRIYLSSDPFDNPNR
jgi:hypothetical protein